MKLYQTFLYLTLMIMVMVFMVAMVLPGTAFGRTQATIITASKTVTLAATPEAMVASETFSSDAFIQAKSTNTVAMFVGPCSGTQNISLLADAVLSISEIGHGGSEIEMDLNRICLKVGVNGEGANIMYTKIVSQ